MYLKKYTNTSRWFPLRSGVLSFLAVVSMMLVFTIPKTYGAFGDRITVSGAQFTAGAQRIWINGANTPWNAWDDFGGSFDATWWTNHFQSLHDNNVNATRVWITCDGQVGININASGVVSGATAAHWANLDTLFQIAQSKGVYIMATILSFDHTSDYHANYQSWRNMLTSSSNVDTWVNNYVIPFVNRYKTNPYLWSIDLCNEPDWDIENASAGAGVITWDHLQVYFAKAAVAIHANSNILVTVGISMGPKYNSATLGQDVVSDAALQAKVNNPAARLDFLSPHHYDWMTDIWGNPFYMTPVAYGLDGSKPAIIGECPSVGTSGHTTTQDYEGNFTNGWQGAQAWTSNAVDGNGGMAYLGPATTAFKNNHPSLVYPSAGAPAAPTNLTATAGNAQVALSWTASSGATSYNVYRGTTAGGESTTPIASGIATTTFTNTGLTNGMTYYYTVAAVNAAGTSGYSNEPPGVTPSGGSLPTAPTTLVGTPGPARVVLNWNTGAGATSYNVYRGTTSGGESPTAIATGITMTTYTNTGRTNGTHYYYWVKSVNAAGTSTGHSPEVDVVPVAAPPAPTNLVATAGNAQVVLNWSASVGALTYNVYRGTTPGGEPATPIVTGVTATTYTNTGLTNGGHYYYRVSAVNGGTSGYSNEVSATPTAGGGTIKVEAESGTLTGCSTATALAGYSGTAYVNGSTLDQAGDNLAMTVNIASAGSKTLHIRYAAVNGMKMMNVYVNGVLLGGQPTTFPAASTWADLNLTGVAFNAGNNLVEIKPGWAYVDFDYIEVF